MKVVALKDRTRTPAEAGIMQLGWDAGPQQARIAWLSTARRLIETGRCGSYVEARRLAPTRSWSVAELAHLDRLRSSRSDSPGWRAA